MCKQARVVAALSLSCPSASDFSECAPRGHPGGQRTRASGYAEIDFVFFDGVEFLIVTFVVPPRFCCIVVVGQINFPRSKSLDFLVYMKIGDRKDWRDFRDCKKNNCPELFLPLLYSSQTREKFFEAARSMTSTNSTVVNFSIFHLHIELTGFFLSNLCKPRFERKIRFYTYGKKVTAS